MTQGLEWQGKGSDAECSHRIPLSVMNMVVFRTIFFELLVFFMFTLLTLHFAY